MKKQAKARSPRGKKIKNQTKARGVFEKVKDSGVWWIRYRDRQGKLHREKVGTYSAAIDAHGKRRAEIREGKFFPGQPRRVNFEQLVNNIRSRPSSLDAGRYQRLMEQFGKRPAGSITKEEIERFLNELEDEGRSPATLNRYRAALSTIFEKGYPASQGYKHNPAKLVKLRKENNQRVRFLEDEEEKRLREVIRERWPEREAEFDLALHTGMRRGEQYGLRWQDVNLKLGLLTIPKSKHGESRHIELNSTALAALKTLALNRDQSGYVCPRQDRSKVIDGLRRFWTAATRAAGVSDFHWHDLRHTFASRLVMEGVDLRTVQEFMGHKGISMTLRYSHLASAHKRAAVERIVRQADGSIPPSITGTPKEPKTEKALTH